MKVYSSSAVSLSVLLLIVSVSALLSPAIAFEDDEGDVIDIDGEESEYDRYTKASDVDERPERGPLANVPATAATCIIGAGPAGLQLAYFLARAGRDFVVLEKDDAPGSFFKRYPRHGTLISLNKLATGGDDDDEFSMRHDWNSLLTDADDPRGGLRFSNFSEELYPPKEAMLRYLSTYASKYELNPHIHFNVAVGKVARAQEARRAGPLRLRFRLLLEASGDAASSLPHAAQTASLGCGVVVVAAGLPDPAYPRSAPGFEFTEGYEDFDPATAAEKYRNKRVLILGTGNSAFEVANNISGVANIVQLCSRNPPRFSWQTHYAGDVRSINAAFLDMYQLKSQHYMDTCIVSSETSVLQHPDGALEFDVTQADEIDEDYDTVRQAFYRGRGLLRDYTANSATYDHIIRALGFRASVSLYERDTKPQMDRRKKYPLLTPSWESVNVPHLFFAGTLMAGRDNRRSSVFAIHGFRYATRTLFNTLESRYYNQTWPGQNLPHDSAAVASAILDRIQYSGSLYQMFGTICEVFYFERKCAEEHRVDAILEPIQTESCWRHETELPCDQLFTSEAYTHRNFLVVTLEYHPDFGKTQEKFNVFGDNRVDSSLHPDEGYKSNFLHPVVRYFTPFRDDGTQNPHFNVVDPAKATTAEDANEWHDAKAPTQAVAVHHMMESVHIDFAHAEAHIEPLVRFLEGLFHTRPELLPKAAEIPLQRVKLRRFHMTSARNEKPAPAPEARLHPQEWLDKVINMKPANISAAYRHTLDLLRPQGADMMRSAKHFEPEWQTHRVLEGMEGGFLDYGYTNSPEDGEDGDSDDRDDSDDSNFKAFGSAGGHSREHNKEEQLQAFGEHLLEALDRPFGGLPELDAVEETARRAKEAAEGLEQRLHERRKQAGGDPDKKAASIDVAKLKAQDHMAVAASLPTTDGKELTKDEQVDAAEFMRSAASMMDELDRLSDLFYENMDKDQIEEFMHRKKEYDATHKDTVGPENKPRIRIKPKKAQPEDKKAKKKGKT